MKVGATICLVVAGITCGDSGNLKFKAEGCSPEIELCVGNTNVITNKDGVSPEDIGDAAEILAACMTGKPRDCKVSAEGTFISDTNACDDSNHWDIDTIFLDPIFSPIGLTDIKFESDLECLKGKKTYKAYNQVDRTCDFPAESAAFELKVENAKHVTYKLPKDFTRRTSGLPLRLPNCILGKATLTVRDKGAEDKGAGARIAALAGIAALATAIL